MRVFIKPRYGLGWDTAELVVYLLLFATLLVLVYGLGKPPISRNEEIQDSRAEMAHLVRLRVHHDCR